jgi:hypothetical protein
MPMPATVHGVRSVHFFPIPSDTLSPELLVLSFRLQAFVAQIPRTDANRNRNT